MYQRERELSESSMEEGIGIALVRRIRHYSRVSVFSEVGQKNRTLAKDDHAVWKLALRDETLRNICPPSTLGL